MNLQMEIAQPLDDGARWRVVLSKDRRFDGAFVMGVHSTGIFCRPTCPARRPKPENIEFFASTGDAELAGYRACKRCKPLGRPSDTPEWLKPLLAEVEQDPARRWRDRDIRALKLEPVRVRRSTCHWNSASPEKRIGRGFIRFSTTPFRSRGRN